MNTRSCLLTVGVSALLATGSVIIAAPASAAPGSAECVAAQAALEAQIGVASVDITLANQLRAAMASLETVGARLESLYAQAELASQHELAAVDNAAVIEAAAWERLEAAEAALAALDPEDPAVEAANLERQEAREAYDAAAAELDRADAAYNAVFATPEILALEGQVDAAVVSFEDAFTRLGLTAGTNPEDLITLADATIAACSAPAVVQAPVVRTAAPQQRGLNIQTAAHDAGATDPANLALLAGLAGFGAAAAAGAVVMLRRSAPRA